MNRLRADESDNPRGGRGAPAWRSPSLPIAVGISSCLLGEEVRYDGGHQRDSFVTGVLARHFAWVSVCPEMEMGYLRPHPKELMLRNHV